MVKAVARRRKRLIALAALVLLARPNVIAELINALRDAYTSFTYALSLGWL